MQQGPCLDHCYKCPRVTMIMANISFIHIFACIVYLVMTRKIGTPFYDSLTKEQLKIKKKSVAVRKKIYMIGIVIGIVILIFWKPFTKFKFD